MPIYDYQCSHCKYKFEIQQKISAETLKECPKCHKNDLKRLISKNIAIAFKGSGFYITDNRKKELEPLKK